MNVYCNQPARGVIHQIVPPCLFVHPCLIVFVDSCVSSRGCSTWSDPLSRLGGDLWGRLRPPSLPSPLPCPGRGMKDLEGLSTALPLG